MTQKTAIEIMPARAGEANQEPAVSNISCVEHIDRDYFVGLPILANSIHWMPRAPRATRAKPTVAPTILCVPDTGKLKNVATSSQIQQPVRENIHLREHRFECHLPSNDDTCPSINSLGLSMNRLGSMIPFRIVSDTFAPRQSMEVDVLLRSKASIHQSVSIPEFRRWWQGCMPVARSTLCFPRSYQTNWPHRSRQYRMPRQRQR
jgi:hypothetical protein